MHGELLNILSYTWWMCGTTFVPLRNWTFSGMGEKQAGPYFCLNMQESYLILIRSFCENQLTLNWKKNKKKKTKKQKEKHPLVL